MAGDPDASGALPVIESGHMNSSIVSDSVGTLSYVVDCGDDYLPATVGGYVVPNLEFTVDPTDVVAAGDGENVASVSLDSTCDPKVEGGGS